MSSSLFQLLWFLGVSPLAVVFALAVRDLSREVREKPHVCSENTAVPVVLATGHHVSSLCTGCYSAVYTGEWLQHGGRCTCCPDSSPGPDRGV